MNLHPSFVSRIHKDFGDDAEVFLASLETNPITSIRFNDTKVGLLELEDRVPWATNAMYLNSRPVFTQDPLFNVGAYYVQEASSMFLEQAFNQYVEVTHDSVILDLCASPGGKSTLLASLMNGRGLLVSNEVVSQRVAPLRENITKWGYPNCVVTNSDPSVLGKNEGLFDAILIDAPCSGEGMFRKDEQAVNEWSPENVDMCAKRQRDILEYIYPALKDNGILIYSTCTYNNEEDENNVRWICSQLGGEVLPIQIKEEWGVVDSKFGYHFYPYSTKGEGFFLAVIRKHSDTGRFAYSKVKNQKEVKSAIGSQLSKYILNPSDFVISETSDNMYIATPKAISEVVNHLKNSARVVQSGVLVAQLKGKDIIPATPLALSSILDRNATPVVELNWRDAMAFLRRESFPLPSSPKGWLLVTFRNIPLGWLKNLGNRTNSSYPNEWHVRMQADESLYTPVF